MDDVEPNLPTARQPAKISPEDLSNFLQVDWVSHHQRTGQCSLRDELELKVYNLLDAGFPGEEGAKVAIDDTAGEFSL